MDDEQTKPKITEDDYKLTSVTETAIKWLWITTAFMVIGVPLIALLLD